jgi:MFS transporter, MHS family, proline/betaine transporter
VTSSYRSKQRPPHRDPRSTKRSANNKNVPRVNEAMTVSSSARAAAVDVTSHVRHDADGDNFLDENDGCDGNNMNVTDDVDVGDDDDVDDGVNDGFVAIGQPRRRRRSRLRYCHHWFCCCRRSTDRRHRPWSSSPSTMHETLKTIAGLAGNVLEWYDFAVFGFFSDILGQVFFPNDQSQDKSVMESFAVFGCAFLMRPVGGLVIGYIGDVSGRKHALEISIFLMAVATTLMGCLPTYQQIGNGAILLLLLVRMLQGLSVGGQLMSSLVFTLEGHPPQRWGLYGSFVMAGANVGTLLGGIVAYALRSSLTEQQLLLWGWRIPFLSGISVSFCGLYLKYFCKEDEIMPGHHSPIPLSPPSGPTSGPATTGTVNPLRAAFSRENRRPLLASAMVPLLWSGGFYLSFVWMAIFMRDLIDPPVPAAFRVNSCSLLLLVVLFPIAGTLSDVVGRRRAMSFGGILFGGVGPIVVLIVGNWGNKSAWLAFGAQATLSVSLAMWGAPMCAWLVEAFEPQARLTSVSIGYNVAQVLGGGLSPLVATMLVDKVGTGAPGILLVVLAMVSLTGLWCVAPNASTHTNHKQTTRVRHQAQPDDLDWHEPTNFEIE